MVERDVGRGKSKLSTTAAGRIWPNPVATGRERPQCTIARGISGRYVRLQRSLTRSELLSQSEHRAILAACKSVTGVIGVPELVPFWNIEKTA